VHALALALTLLLPKHGTLVPYQSLGGVQLGMTPVQVTSAWGTRHGRCRGCADATWYYTYKPFTPTGAGVSFHEGKVSAVFTLWSPTGWHAGALVIGDPKRELTTRYHTAIRVPCASYEAYIVTRNHVTTAFYVYDGKVWGFALIPSSAPACR
jgi:hypothetical protein